MKHLPNFFTLINLLFGSLAVIFILQSGETLASVNEDVLSINLPEKIWLGSLCIGIAAAVDFLDGLVARLCKATSPLGKELDSLADVVSFGVAPGMILYQFLRMSFAKQQGALDVSMLWLVPAIFIPCAAAYRLAKFNIDSSQQYGFKGVPTPATALLIASFPFIFWYSNNETILSLLLNKWFLYALIIALSYLMVSNLPLMAMKFKDLSLQKNLPKIILLVIAIIAALLFKWIAVPIVFLFYIVLSLGFKNKTT
ncbi:MAG TPA: CDP-alcohol phosphatidyltransferase family protein [Puia sp.]|jgi:CDP-diacylglycerol--serine O-phosphatidyltransferase|nr:CDP-alcohol phosphatidyltransferase family protein [Puia sp.]